MGGEGLDGEEGCDSEVGWGGGGGGGYNPTPPSGIVVLA